MPKSVKEYNGQIYGKQRRNIIYSTITEIFHFTLNSFERFERAVNFILGCF